jgi:flagellar protein FlbT
MALKITLKPGEKMLVGTAVVTNGNGKNCDLIIENNVPILRQKDILREEDLSTPCRQIYFTVQLMYIDPDNLAAYHRDYWKQVQDVVGAAPSATVLIDHMNEEIVGGRYYQALKLARKLIDYEQEVVNRV